MKPRHLEGACVALLSGAIVVAPLLLGASGAWTRLGLEAATAAAALLWAWSDARRPAALWVPLVVVAAFLVQLVPLPQPMIAAVAPASAAAWQAAGSTADGAAHPVSIDPAATAAGIRRLLLALVTIAVVADLAQGDRWRNRFVGALAVSAMALWASGLVFRTTPEDRVILGCVDLKGPIDYWLTPLEPAVRTCGVGERTQVVAGSQRYEILDSRAGDGFGPYIYSNHFAGALGLTVPALLATLPALAPAAVPAWGIRAIVFAVAAAAVWTNAGVVRSRAGAAALVVGLLVFFALAATTRRARRLLAAAALAALACLAAAVACVYGPLRGIDHFLSGGLRTALGRLSADPRVADTATALRMFRGSPWVGSGLGTYGEMNAMIDDGRFISHYAHNDYAQLLAETGLLGGLVAAGFIAFCGWRLARYLRRPGPGDAACSAAGWAALAAIAVHSFFDWNLHLPANALLACVAAGIALASGAAPSSAAPPVARSTAWPGRVARVAFTAACVTALVFCARDAASEAVQRQLRTAIAADRLRARDAEAPAATPALLGAVTRGERFAPWDSSSAALPLLLGHAYLHLAAEASSGAAAAPELDAAARWLSRAQARAAMPVRIHATAPPPPT